MPTNENAIMSATERYENIVERAEAIVDDYDEGRCALCEVERMFNGLHAEVRRVFYGTSGDFDVMYPLMEGCRSKLHALQPHEDALTGERITNDMERVVCGVSWYLTEANAIADGWTRCEVCDEWCRTDDCETVEVDGHVYCTNSCAYEAGYEQCRNCGEWFHYNGGENGYVLGDDEAFCCGDCANEYGLRECDRCGEWTNDVHTVVSGGVNEGWCYDCWDYHARTCEACGNWVNEDDGEYDDDDDWVCTRCQGSSTARLHEYGWTPRIEFFGDAKKSPYLGIELETDGGSARTAYVGALGGIEKFPEHFWMTRDSSLDNGVEITGHPMTLKYHYDELLATYERISEVAHEWGFRSHDGGRCGLHVHVNRDFFGKSTDMQDLGGYKMMRLLQRFETEFVKFSRRRSTGWCNFQTRHDYAPLNPGEVESVSEVMRKAGEMKYETNHSQALNFQHSATFEVRIYRGTLKVSTFFACLGMTNGLAHVARDHSAHYVETVEWDKLMRDVVKACDEPHAREMLLDYLEAKSLL